MFSQTAGGITRGEASPARSSGGASIDRHEANGGSQRSRIHN